VNAYATQEVIFYSAWNRPELGPRTVTIGASHEEESTTNHAKVVEDDSCFRLAELRLAIELQQTPLAVSSVASTAATCQVRW
jgi:hypothetical protein